VFGTTDPSEIATIMASLTFEAVGADVTEGLWYRSSVAAVAGLALDDGRSVVLHAYRRDVTSGFISGVVRMQRYVAGAGFPRAHPLSGPVEIDAVIRRDKSLRGQELARLRVELGVVEPRSERTMLDDKMVTAEDRPSWSRVANFEKSLPRTCS
jgi:hypothetical protein